MSCPCHFVHKKLHVARHLLGRSEGNEAGDTSFFCQRALTLPKGALSFLKKAKILILAVYDENIPPIKLILPNGNLVRLPIQFCIGASRLASLFRVFRTRPEDKPDATYQDCQ